MRSLLKKVSSISVKTNSCPLRSKVRSPDKNKFLASCWVMVEPPTTLGGRAGRAGFLANWAARLLALSSAFEFFTHAFSKASQSTPS